MMYHLSLTSFLVVMFCGDSTIKVDLPQRPAAPAVVASYCEIKNTDGHSWIFLPEDAVDYKEGQFYLRPRIVGEKDCRTDTIFIRLVAGGYELATTKGLSINTEGKILFENQMVEAFDIFKAP